jgi:hypothetical protein
MSFLKVRLMLLGIFRNIHFLHFTNEIIKKRIPENIKMAALKEPQRINYQEPCLPEKQKPQTLKKRP